MLAFYGGGYNFYIRKEVVHLQKSSQNNGILEGNMKTEPVVHLQKSSQINDLKKAAKVFMIIGCVLSGFCFLIFLLWTIPMTTNYCKKIKNGESVSTEFKVCSLLFVSKIAGILMLIDND